MSDWPSYITAPNGKWVRLEDFERLLEFAISAIQALGQTDRNREAIRHDILETMQEREWREKEGENGHT